MSGTRQAGRIDHKKPRQQVLADRRAVRTRLALHQALIKLILRKDYDAISVGDLVAEANVGRSTFYAHYTGKDDLTGSAADWIREALLDHQRSDTVAGHEGHGPLGFSRFMFEHSKEQLRLHRALVRGRAGTIVRDKIRALLAELLRDDLRKLGGLDSGAIPREFAVQYVVGGFMAALTWWLDRGAKEPPEEMDAAFRKLVLHGLGSRSLRGRAE